MKPASPGRALVAQSLIACMLLAGAVAVVGGPLRLDLAEARSRLRALKQRAEREVGVDPGAAPAREPSQDPDARAEEIRRRSERAADSGALFDAIMRLAAETSVRIDKLEPRAGGATPGGEGRLISTSFTIAATGSYENLTAFLASVEREAGYVTTTSMRLTPVTDASGKALVAATFETNHRAFTIGEATAGATEAPAQGEGSDE